MPRAGTCPAKTVGAEEVPVAWLKRVGAILKEGGVRWWDDSCYRLGASLAFYALFSIFPLLLVAATVLGFFLGEEPSSRERILASVAGLFSRQFRDLLDETLTSMQLHQTARGVGGAIGAITLLFGASGAFSELETLLKRIWRVTEVPSSGVWGTIVAALEQKATSFTAVAGAGAILFASLFVSTALNALSAAAMPVLPDFVAWRVMEALVSLGLTTLVFAVIFRVLPQAGVKWRDVMGGAFFTAILFIALNHVLAWYLTHLGSYAAYGAVGGVLGLLMWIYVVSLLVFFGAELTRVYAEREGSLVPQREATRRASPA